MSGGPIIAPLLSDLDAVQRTARYRVIPRLWQSPLSRSANFMTKGTGPGTHGCSQSRPSRGQTPTPLLTLAHRTPLPVFPAGASRFGLVPDRALTEWAYSRAFIDHADDQGHLVWRVLMLTLAIRSLGGQIGDNHASTSPTTLNDGHAHNSHCRWPARPILVCDRLRHGAAADAPTVGISSSQPLVDRRLWAAQARESRRIGGIACQWTDLGCHPATGG